MNQKVVHLSTNYYKRLFKLEKQLNIDRLFRAVYILTKLIVSNCATVCIG